MSTLVHAAADTAVCALDRQLLAGEKSCPGCPREDLATCIAYSSDSKVCDPASPENANGTYVAKGCQLSTTVNNCKYQCMMMTPTTREATLTFYVTPSSMPTNDTVKWGEDKLHQSERYVQKIGRMDLPDRYHNLNLVGGESVDNSSAIVDVQVTLSLSATNLEKLTLANINMHSATTPLIQISQPTPMLNTLRIQNCKIDKVPVELRSLTALTTLDLSQNQLNSLPASYGMEQLTTLILRNNSLNSMDAAFPALTSLDLSNNRLRAIPDIVYRFTKLKELNLSGNELEQPTFKHEQFWFLSNLTSLTLDGFSDQTASCALADLQLLKAFKVCVTDETKAIPTSQLPWYVIGPVAGTVLVMLLGFSLWYRRRKKRFVPLDTLASHRLSKTPILKDDADISILSSPSTTTGSSHGRLRTPTSSAHGFGTSSSVALGSLWADEKLLACQLKYEDIEDIEQIGAGAYGVVWLVRYRQSKLLASKRLVKDQVTRQRTQTFVAEIKIVAELEHPSIVQFVGVAWTVESDLQALFEYMPCGDLCQYLETTRDHRIWDHGKVQIAIDVVEALVYVHSFSPPLLHRDLKSKNILLAENMKAKLSDFGISRYQSENGTMTSGVGTGKWLAPEVLIGDNDYDHLSDIYSFGIVLCELDTHRLPYYELQLPDVAVLQMVVAGKTRPQLRDDCPSAIRTLVDRCLSFESHLRPSAMEIAYVLRTFAKTLTH